jgi:hypothetical protein
MGILLACLSVHHVCAGPTEARSDVRFTGTGITDGCGLPCRCRELNLYLLEEQPVLIYAGIALQLQRAELFCEFSISNTS